MRSRGFPSVVPTLLSFAHLSEEGSVSVVGTAVEHRRYFVVGFAIVEHLLLRCLLETHSNRESKTDSCARWHFGFLWSAGLIATRLISNVVRGHCCLVRKWDKWRRCVNDCHRWFLLQLHLVSGCLFLLLASISKTDPYRKGEVRGWFSKNCKHRSIALAKFLSVKNRRRGWYRKL